MSPKVYKIRITIQNINDFYAVDWRKEQKVFKKDVNRLVKKMVGYAEGKESKLTKVYPERYDLTVLTYDQYVRPYCILDGSHRLEAMKIIFKKKLLDGFDFWFIPSNINGRLKTKKEAYELNAVVNKELDKYGLPHWIKKFDFEDRGGKLIAWKNINLIDTGNRDKRKQYKIDWFLNEGAVVRKDIDKHNYKNKYKL